jgi:hypothetical protein
MPTIWQHTNGMLKKVINKNFGASRSGFLAEAARRAMQ